MTIRARRTMDFGQLVEYDQTILDFLLHGRVPRNGLPALGKNIHFALHFHQQAAVGHLEKMLHIDQLIVDMPAKEKDPYQTYNYEALGQGEKSVTSGDTGVQKDPEKSERRLLTPARPAKPAASTITAKPATILENRLFFILALPDDGKPPTPLLIFGCLSRPQSPGS